MSKTVRKRKTTKRKPASRKPAPAASGKTNKYLKYGALAAGAYLVFNALNKPAAASPASVSPLAPQSGLVPSTTPVKIVAPTVTQNTNLPLVLGSKGELVKTLQRTLLSKGGAAANYIRESSIGSNGDVDGSFGPGTKNAVFAAGRTYPVYDVTW